MHEKISFRPDEAAQVTGIRRTKIYELIASGQLRSVKIGKARLIPREALEELLTAQDQAA